MRTLHSPRLLGLTRSVRIGAALVTMLQLLLVAFAPLAERQESTVAAIHVEQGGTSTHHAHGELCAVCAASHLVGPPARAATAAVMASVTTSARGDSRGPSTAADRLTTQPRAPPA